MNYGMLGFGRYEVATPGFFPWLNHLNHKFSNSQQAKSKSLLLMGFLPHYTQHLSSDLLFIQDPPLRSHALDKLLRMALQHSLGVFIHHEGPTHPPSLFRNAKRRLQIFLFRKEDTLGSPSFIFSEGNVSIHEIPDAVLKVAALFLLCLGGYLQQCWPHLTQVGVWEGVKKVKDDPQVHIDRVTGYNPSQDKWPSNLIIAYNPADVQLRITTQMVNQFRRSTP